MSSAEKIKRLFAKSDVTVNSKIDDRIISDAFTALDKSEKTQLVSAEPNIWRIIMKGRIVKFTVAATILVAVMTILSQLDSSLDGTSIAFGEVLRHIQNSSYTFDLATVIEGEVLPTVNKGMVLRPGKFRIDAPQIMGGVSTIADISTKKSLILFHGQKTAMTMTEIPGTKSVPKEAGPLVLFLRPVENLWNLRDGTEKSIGEKEIDGQPAVGFQVQQEGKDYQCEIVVWAHAETGRPIRVEITIYNPEDSSQSMTMVMSRFDLDAELDEEPFSLEPPEGYTMAYQKTLEETITDTESTPEAEKIERSFALWSQDKKDEAVETLLSVDWTKPIEFSEKMYLFTLTEKGYVALKPEDQQQVMKEIMEILSSQLRGLVREIWNLARTAKSSRNYKKAELCLETSLNLGRLINRNPEGILVAQTVGLSIRRKSLDEMVILYKETNHQEKLQRVEEEIRKVDAERESFRESIKSKFGGQ